MSRPSPPALTVRYEGTTRNFAPGHDVVVGRDLRADIRIAHPLTSRAHLLLRFDQGRWVAVDNGSLNGMFVDGRRVPAVDLADGLRLHVGNPDGPQLLFEVGRHQGSAGRPPQTTVIPAGRPPSASGSWGTPGPPAGPPGPQTGAPRTGGLPPRYPTGSQPASPRSGQHPAAPSSGQFPGPPSSGQFPGPPSSGQFPGPPSSGQFTGPAWSGRHPAAPERPPQSTSIAAPANEPATALGPTAAPRAAGEGNLATSMMKILRPARGGGGADAPGAVKIGRAEDNDIVIPDVLASRHHATLIPGSAGTAIVDARSINGTFVNGARVDRRLLEDGDVVTIGNVDLVFTGSTLARRSDSDTATRTGGLEVHGVDFTVEHDRKLLDNVAFTARPGTLTALIGPSGAGKSTLAKLIAGYTQPSSGVVTFEGHDIHAEYASLRSRIGMVPQDDVVHGQLTVKQALMYAAELRLPPDTTRTDREQVVMQVLEELEMTNHLETRVDKLSGGQRKRASVALELLTGPSLLILDEPTSGLDPALDRQVMAMLRQLADAGRVVLVVTHSLTYLDVCDEVLLLAPGGKTAFYGPPSQIGPSLGTTNWADIFSSVAADPESAKQRYLDQHGPPAPTPQAQQPSDLGAPVHTSVLRQFSTISRRQFRLIVADRGYFLFLAMLPFIMGTLALTVPGDVGFGVPVPATEGGEAPNEPGQILVLLNVGAIFMGTALTIRALIGERAIFRREQAVGLSTTAYLLAKVTVFTLFALIQSAIAVAITVVGKGWGPGSTESGALLPNRTFELYLAVAGTCVAAAMVGLALSALAKSNEQIMPLLVVAIMSQLVFSGGMIPVTDRIGLDQLSWLTPARWGFAATASTIDLIRLVPGPLTPQDSHWVHEPGPWLFDMGMLLAICVGYLALVRYKIRLRAG